MSNIIQLLEQLGQDANLQTPEAYQEAIAHSGLSDSLKAALAQQVPQNVAIFAAPDEEDPEYNAKALLEEELKSPKVEAVLILPAEDDDSDSEEPSDDNAENAVLTAA